MKAEDQEKELLEIADSDIKRETKIGVDFYHAMYKRHDNDREKAWQVFKKMKETKDGEDKLIKIYETKTIRKKYWEWMRGLKFIASPFGNGLDCHRTYEALMLGCIPIVRDYNPTSKGLNPLRELYKDLPVHFVNEWDEIYEMDEEQLNEIYDKADFSKVKERLTLDYWWK